MLNKTILIALLATTGCTIKHEHYPNASGYIPANEQIAKTCKEIGRNAALMEVGVLMPFNADKITESINKFGCKGDWNEN